MINPNEVYNMDEDFEIIRRRRYKSFNCSIPPAENIDGNKYYDTSIFSVSLILVNALDTVIDAQKRTKIPKRVPSYGFN